MTDHISITRDGGVQVLRLNRSEKKNALTQAMYHALSDAFKSGDADDDIRAHVILGCDGVFCAGNDIADFLAHATGAKDGSGLKDVMAFLHLLPNIKKPILAGVDGQAIGIGTTLLFHCDMVFATEHSSFATPFLDLGLVPEAGSSYLMPRRMGYARAFEMLVLGAPYDSEQMKAAGLLNSVVGPDVLEETVMTAAQRLAKKPPKALMISRQLMRGKGEELKQRIQAEAVEFEKCLRSDEARTAFQAFMSKSR